MVATQTAPSTPARPINVPLLAWAVVAVGLVTTYLVLQGSGALLQTSLETLHELFHDGRHALGVPCH